MLKNTLPYVLYLPESVAVAHGCVAGPVGKEVAEGKEVGFGSTRNALAAGWPEAHVEVDAGVFAADCVLDSHYIGRGRFRPLSTAHSLSSRRKARSHHAAVHTPGGPQEQAGCGRKLGMQFFLGCSVILFTFTSKTDGTGLECHSKSGIYKKAGPCRIGIFY